NLRLSRTAFSAGEIGLVEILRVNRQVLDVRRDLIDALIQLHLTRVDLEQSAGWPPSLAPAER
ncbi:MAG: TolC family protein, partial [Azospira oryzae]